jgi:hypothetical protein
MFSLVENPFKSSTAPFATVVIPVVSPSAFACPIRSVPTFTVTAPSKLNALSPFIANTAPPVFVNVTPAPEFTNPNVKSPYPPTVAPPDNVNPPDKLAGT